jgi:hypothetical protein
LTYHYALHFNSGKRFFAVTWFNRAATNVLLITIWGENIRLRDKLQQQFGSSATTDSSSIAHPKTGSA